MLTIRPRPLAQQQRCSRLAAEKGCPSNPRRAPGPHSASLIFSSGLKAMTPAELTSVSRPPNRASQTATAAAADSGDVTSNSTASRPTLPRAAFGVLQAIAIDVPDRDLSAACQPWPPQSPARSRSPHR